MSSTIGGAVLDKITAPKSVELITSRGGQHKVFYQEACRYWAKASNFQPRFVLNGETVDQPHGRTISFDSENAAAFVNCLLNSSLFYWYYSTLADCEHVNDSLVRGFPLLDSWTRCDWISLSGAIDRTLRQGASPKTIRTRQGHVIEYDETDGRVARESANNADVALGTLYALSASELDYIINYDIKYRMGKGGDDDSDD